MLTASHNVHQVYSNGLSEIILGNAIKKLVLPRDELVIMTKVCTSVSYRHEPELITMQLCGPVMKDYSINIWHTGQSPDEFGVINQKGLNRKVRPSSVATRTLG